MEVVLVRHTSVKVPKGTCYGWTDVPLADSFPEEAARTKKQLEGIAFDKVYSSPLSRAHRLATFCGFPDAILDDRLKEMNMGDWEMRTYEDIEENDPHIRQWYDDYMHEPATNGESFPDLYRRVTAFLDELRTMPCQKVAVFAHGGVLISAGLYAGLYPANDPFRFITPYGGILRITL